MTRAQMLAQLDAIRALTEALAASLLAEPAADGGACAHPEEMRQDASTMGGGPRRFYCRLCHETVEGL